MKKYLSLYLRIFKLSFMTEMESRTNFWVWAFVHTITLITMIIFFQAIYLNTSAINGWNRYQSLLVLGVGSLVAGLGSLTFFPFMYNFGNGIQTGEFDSKLVKPVDILFQSAICWVDIEDLVVVPNSLMLIIYALYKLNPTHMYINVSVFPVLILCSLLLLFALLTLIQSLAFKHVRVDAAINFYWSLVNMTKYPIKSIKSASVILLILILPLSVISSVPAEVLFGRFDLPWIALSLVLSVSLLIFSIKVFYSSLKHYSSASS